MRNYNQRTALILIGLLLSLTLSASMAAAQIMSGGKYKITSSVQAGGGGLSTGSGNKVIEGTAGQTAVGPSGKSPFAHDAGFWSTTFASAAATPTPTPTPTSTPTPTPTPSATPTVSVNDVSQAEGNSGITNRSMARPRRRAISSMPPDA